jgi:O-acetyl-ADP-ribose deacetylase (regulator of RNase III)
MPVSKVTGDLLDQPVDVIVNPWNRNLIPWWLLLPHGVSGAIKKRGGYRPFIELRRHGVLPLGGAALTSAGRLPFKAIIHVAGIGHTWRSSENSIRASVISALKEARTRGFTSIAFPLIGAGIGGTSPDEAQRIMEDEILHSDYEGKVVLVRYQAPEWPYGSCYCNLWNKEPEMLKKQGIPKGYCGLCEVCGAPGHLQHFPGSVPYTGAWCRKHYYRTMILHPLGSIGILTWSAGIIFLIALIILMTKNV